MKQTKKVIAILITACLMFTALPVFVNATEAPKSIILNEGNDIGLVKLQWNCTDQVTTAVVEDESPYGPAYAMTAGEAGSGWNNYKTGFVMPVGDTDISGMTGFAFYVKAPQDVDTSVNPLLDLFFYNTDNNVSNALVVGENLYYVPAGSAEVTTVEFRGGDYPISNMPGYEGFVFIPFSTMKNTWGGTALTSENVVDYKSFELRLNIANSSDALAGKTYIIDEIGFYTDPLAYVAYVEEQNANRVYAEPIELVANDGGVFDAWSDENDSFTVSHTVTSNTGLAYNLYSGGENPNWYWAQFPMPKEGYDVSATSGVAFYIEIPDDLDNCRMQVRLSINDNEKYYNDPILNKMYYVADGSATVEEETIQPGYYPFEGRKGFKGWFFLPYGAMQSGGSTTNAAEVNAADSFRIAVCIISGDSADHNRNYVIDQIGYYSNPLDYIAAATDGYMRGDADGDKTVGASDLVVFRKALFGTIEFTDKLFHAVDYNKDGVTDVRDLIRFKKDLV